MPGANFPNSTPSRQSTTERDSGHGEGWRHSFLWKASPQQGDFWMKRAALYLRVSTIDQHPETQGIEVRQFAQQRGYEIVEEYIDHGFSGTITLGYGDPGCEDRLNTLYYRVPILNEERPMGGPDRLVVLLDSTV